MSHIGSELDQAKGRTAWDFASLVLVRLGPLVMIIAGFMAVVLFLYREVSEARFKANEDLLRSLDAAQKQIVENTTKMGEMSRQIMDNMRQLLDLNKQVNVELEENKRQAREIIRKASDEMERTRATHADLSRRVESLNREAHDLEIKKKNVEEKNMHLDSIRKINDREISLIAEEIMGARENEQKRKGISEGERLPIATQLIERFHADPLSVDVKDFDNIIGMPLSQLEPIAREGRGYDLWYTLIINADRQSLVGVRDETIQGANHVLVFYAMQGRVYKVQLGLGRRVLCLPSADNWYQRWVVLLRVFRERTTCRYYDFDVCPLEMTRDQLAKLEEYLNRVMLHGTERAYEVVSPKAAEIAFGDRFTQWTKEADGLGRPKLIFSMLERAERFNAEDIPGMDRAAFPNGLKDSVNRILAAAVASRAADIAQHLDPAITTTDLGRIAAMALRDALRVTQVALRGEGATTEADVRFTFDPAGASLSRERGEGRLSFRKAEGRWLLASFSANL